MISLSIIDINTAVNNPDVCFFAPELKGGHAITFPNSNNLICGSGSFAVVYKYQLKDGTYKAIRIWQNIEKSLSIIHASQVISNELKKIVL